MKYLDMVKFQFTAQDFEDFARGQIKVYRPDLEIGSRDPESFNFKWIEDGTLFVWVVTDETEID